MNVTSKFFLVGVWDTTAVFFGLMYLISSLGSMIEWDDWQTHIYTNGRGSEASGMYVVIYVPGSSPRLRELVMID